MLPYVPSKGRVLDMTLNWISWRGSSSVEFGIHIRNNFRKKMYQWTWFPNCCLTREENDDNTCKNISLFVYYYEIVAKLVAWIESLDWQGTVKIYTRLKYDIFREPYFFALHLRFFFVLPPWGWYRSIHNRGHR